MLETILFSEWVQLSHWETLFSKNKDFGGIYLFGKFDKDPPTGPANPLEKTVIYIGQSTVSFKQRWRLVLEGLNNPDLAKSQPGHYPRVMRYITLFGENSHLPYVACLPIQDIGRAFLKLGYCPYLEIDSGFFHGKDVSIFLEPHFNLVLNYIEHRLIWLYACEHGVIPVIQKDS